MEKRITNSARSFLENELQRIMDGYENFRLELAHIGRQGGNIAEALKGEVIWENKIKQLKGLLKDKKTVYPKRQKETINIGSKILIVFNDGQEKELILDGVGYGGKQIKIVSCHSQIGQQLLGKKLGDKIIAQNKAEIIIKEIYYPW